MEIYLKYLFVKTRIIFLDVPIQKCCKRLNDRRVNIYSGEVDYLPNITAKGEKYKQMFNVHPSDLPSVIEEEHKEFLEGIEVRLIINI